MLFVVVVVAVCFNVICYEYSFIEQRENFKIVTKEKGIFKGYPSIMMYLMTYSTIPVLPPFDYIHNGSEMGEHLGVNIKEICIKQWFGS